MIWRKTSGHRVPRGKRSLRRTIGFATFLTCYGSCYRSKAFREACRDLGLRHFRTKPYAPKTNGKAERFIQTALREWAYALA